MYPKETMNQLHPHDLERLARLHAGEASEGLQQWASQKIQQLVSENKELNQRLGVALANVHVKNEELDGLYESLVAHDKVTAQLEQWQELARGVIDAHYDLGDTFGDKLQSAVDLLDKQLQSQSAGDSDG